MKIPFTSRCLGLIVIALTIGACSSTRAINEWRDDAFNARLTNLLVIAAIDDDARKRQVEDAYVARLNSLSIEATAAHALISASEITREVVEAAIVDTDIDSVLVTRLLGVEAVEEYQPPVRVDHYRSYHRYHARALDYTSPGYYRRYTVLTLETSLYDRASGELVWSMQSESMDSDAAQKIIDEQIGLTVERLRAAGLIN